jgi:hypothetical protein
VDAILKQYYSSIDEELSKYTACVLEMNYIQVANLSLACENCK